MQEKFEAIKNWIMSNKIVAGIAAVVIAFLLYKKFGKKTYRRRSTRVTRPVARRRTIRRSYNKAGKRLKAWQIKGSAAARRHMAQIRARR